MEVSPFRGIRYNAKLVGDLAEVICPPFDVITPEQQKLYYQRNDYNAIRLELPAEGKEPTDDCYQRAAITFRQWLQQGILRLDRRANFYLHDHYFEHLGKKIVRRGLIARVRLKPWGDGIYPHEETSAKAKSDRLQLMRACRANFSPLLSLYHDSERKVASILSEVAKKKWLMSLRVPSLPVRGNLSNSEETHVLWAISDPQIIRRLTQLLLAQPVYIADGHHRYETALAYQQERARGQPVTGEEGFNYVMMELVDICDPGLVVLPVHRLLRGVMPSVLIRLEEQLRNFFVFDTVPLGSGIYNLPDDSCLGVLGLRPNTLVVLKKRRDVVLETMMSANRSQAYQEFGVSIFNHIVLEKALYGTKELEVSYTVDFKEAKQQIEEGKYQLAFLLNPPRPEVVKAVADAQDRLPSKSTYFYPKLPAGLVINPLD